LDDEFVFCGFRVERVPFKQIREVVYEKHAPRPGAVPRFANHGKGNAMASAAWQEYGRSWDACAMPKIAKPEFVRGQVHGPGSRTEQTAAGLFCPMAALVKEVIKFRRDDEREIRCASLFPV
jgi:hypothetical protein